MAERSVVHCPNCFAEYRAGFTICTDCGHLLVPGAAPEQPQEPAPRATPLDILTREPPQIGEPADLFEEEERVPRRVVLAALPRATAEALIERLTDEEIGARLSDVDASGDVQVLVHDTNLGDAQAALVEVTGDVSLVDAVDEGDTEFVEVASPRLGEAGMQAARLQDAGIKVRVELPHDPEAANDWRSIANAAGSPGRPRGSSQGARDRGLMGATKFEARASRSDAIEAFSAEGCSAPRFWGNGPGDEYGRHSHDYHKVLFCLAGSIVFHTDEGDVSLEAGDRLDLEPGTVHGAMVGPRGCECVEASR